MPRGNRIIGANMVCHFQASIFAALSVIVMIASSLACMDVRADSNDTFAGATTLNPNSKLSGYLDYNSNRNDYFKVVLPSAGTFKAEMKIEEFWEDLDLQIYNSACTKIGGSETIWTTESCELTLDAGTYYVRVFAYGSRDDSAYVLKLDYVPSNLPQLTIGMTYAYTLSASDNTHYFKVKGEGNTLVVNILGPRNANYNMYIRANGLPTVSYYDDKSIRSNAEEAVQVEPDGWYYVMVKRVSGSGAYYIRAHDYEYSMLLDMWEFDRTPMNEEDVYSLGAPKFMIENWDKLSFKSQEESAYWVNYVNSYYAPSEAWTYSAPFPTTKCLSYSASIIADWWAMKRGTYDSVGDYTSFVHGGRERGTNPRTLELIFQERHLTDPQTYVYFSNISIVGFQVWNEKDPVTKEYTPYSLMGYSQILTHPPSEVLTDPITHEQHVVSSTDWLYGLEVNQLTVSENNIKSALQQNGIVYAQIEGPSVVEILRPDGTHAVPIIGYGTKDGKTYFVYHDSYGLQDKKHGTGQVNIRAAFKMIPIDEIDEAYTFVPSQNATMTTTPTNVPIIDTTTTTTTNTTITNTTPMNACNVIISEFLPKPYTVYTKEWVELHNIGATEIDISNWKLDDKAGGSNPYKFPAGTKLPANGYLVFYGNKTHITLDNAGDSVRLLSPSGAVLDEVKYTSSQNDMSYVREQNGSISLCNTPTPGAQSTFTTTNCANSAEPARSSSELALSNVPVNVAITLACAISISFFAFGRAWGRRR